MSHSIERRESRRIGVMLSASVESPTASAPVRVANVSSTGALVLGPALAPQTKVMVRRNGNDAPARIIWSEAGTSGLRFDQPLFLGNFLPTVAAPRRRHTPNMRRPGLRSVPMSDAERRMLETWATAGNSVLGE